MKSLIKTLEKLVGASIIFASLNSAAAKEIVTIDTVYSFKPGTGQTIGQGPEYYPKNIFGVPYSAANESVPASLPEDVCSLGFGGEIVVGFKNFRIIDGPGADFSIFENVFFMDMLQKYFLEPATVSVSEDGVNFVDFPIDTLTLKGCAGTKPTHGSADMSDATACGGDAFDLADIGVKVVNYIKIKDFCSYLKDHKEHPYYNASISGFDLDALVGFNFEKKGSDVVENSNNNELQVKSNNVILPNSDENNNYIIYNNLGEIMLQGETNRRVIEVLTLRSGIYFIYVNSARGAKKYKFYIS
jgi:hypothetical protein